MRLPWLLFGLVLATAVLLLGVSLGVAPEPQLAPHPDHPTLLRATDGAERVAPVWLAGAVFGTLQIAFFGACFALGMRRGASLGTLARPVAIGLAAYFATYLGLLFAYQRFLVDPEPLLLGFPVPTAILLFGLWPVPLLFVWLYLRHFETHVLAPEDLARVRRIARESEDGTH